MSVKQVAICRECHKERPAVPGELCPHCNKSRSYSYTMIDEPDVPPAVVPVAAPASTPPAPQAEAKAPWLVLPKVQLPTMDLGWVGGPINFLLSNFGWLIILILIVPLALQVFAPQITAGWDFTGLSGGQPVATGFDWRQLGTFDISHYLLIVNGLRVMNGALAFVTVCVLLTQGSALADALSGLTGADFTGALGHLIVLVALGMPTTLLKTVVTLTGCFFMNRLGDARRSGKQWIFTALGIAGVVYLVGNTYLSWSATGVVGLFRAIVHTLYTAGSNQAFWFVHAVILWFTFQGFRFERDGSSQASLHFLLAWVALVSGKVPFTPALTGAYAPWTFQNVNLFQIYWSANLIIAFGLYIKEIIKFPTPDKKWVKTFVKPMGNVAIYAATAVVAGLLFVYPKWGFVSALLAGYLVPSMVLGVIHFSMVQTGGEQAKQTIVATYNRIFGDHTVAFILCLVNDNFNAMLLGLSVAVLASPAIAAALRLI